MNVQIGDLIEISSSNGLAYALYTHYCEKPTRFGNLLHVFKERYSNRPESLQEIASSAVQFTTFFPLQTAVNKDIVKIAGNIAVPEKLKMFPVFRCGMIDPRTTKYMDWWWLWNGEKSWRIESLSIEQRRLPIQGICNYTLLLERIEKNWHSENEY